ncbi:glyoxalase/bleomycin resistance protein/dioxygenase [Xylogone sp. PMI_703]|nr:glyoxalase/bleomycin resistance protein/dioxygenase [Xylogone sp. PMI_703]
MPLDHFSIVVPQAKVDDLANFLVDSLKHIDFKEHLRPIPTVIGMGEERPYLWIVGADGNENTTLELLKSQHVAFTAKKSSQVREFHAAALKAGGTCNGPPGPRPEYHPGYYGAFVRDPLFGINFEVVCHSDTGDD